MQHLQEAVGFIVLGDFKVTAAVRLSNCNSWQQLLNLKLLKHYLRYGTIDPSKIVRKLTWTNLKLASFYTSVKLKEVN